MHWLHSIREIGNDSLSQGHLFAKKSITKWAIAAMPNSCPVSLWKLFFFHWWTLRLFCFGVPMWTVLIWMTDALVWNIGMNKSHARLFRLLVAFWVFRTDYNKKSLLFALILKQKHAVGAEQLLIFGLTVVYLTSGSYLFWVRHIFTKYICIDSLLFWPLNTSYWFTMPILFSSKLVPLFAGSRFSI